MGFLRSSGGRKVFLQLRPNLVFGVPVSPPDPRCGLQFRKVRLGLGLDTPAPQGPMVGPTQRESDFYGVSLFFKVPPDSVRPSESPPPTFPFPRDGLQSLKDRRVCRMGVPAPHRPRVDLTHREGDFRGFSSFLRGPLTSVLRSDSPRPTPLTPRDRLQSREGLRWHALGSPSTSRTEGGSNT